MRKIDFLWLLLAIVFSSYPVRAMEGLGNANEEDYVQQQRGLYDTLKALLEDIDHRKLETLFLYGFDMNALLGDRSGQPIPCQDILFDFEKDVIKRIVPLLIEYGMQLCQLTMSYREGPIVVENATEQEAREFNGLGSDLLYAIAFHNKDGARTLLKNNGHSDDELKVGFRVAAGQGLTRTIGSILGNLPERLLTEVLEAGFLRAAIAGHTSIMTILLPKIFDQCPRDENKNAIFDELLPVLKKALSFATAQGRVEVVTMLLKIILEKRMGLGVNRLDEHLSNLMFDYCYRNCKKERNCYEVSLTTDLQLRYYAIKDAFEDFTRARWLKIAIDWEKPDCFSAEIFALIISFMVSNHYSW